MRILELPDMLRKYGVEPVEVAGWQTRGNEFPERPDGALRHWTAGSTTGRTPSLGIVTNGRGGANPLLGPLAQILQSRESGTKDKAYVIASGKANHAGTGIWNGISGNYKLLGNEIEWSGPNEAFSAARIDVSERIMAALLDCCTGTNNDDVAEHREYATPAGRKIDTNLPGNVMRARMAILRSGGATAPQPSPTPGDEDMPNLVIRGDASTEWWFTDGMTKRYARTSEEVAQHVYAGLARANNGGPFVVPQTMVDYLTTLPSDGLPGHKGVLDILDKGTGAGQTGWASTNKAILATIQANANLIAKIPTASVIADAVIAKLPPAQSGGITKADVQSACEAAVDAQLGFLKSGK